MDPRLVATMRAIPHGRHEMGHGFALRHSTSS
jgi:hypothetical protein